MYLPSLARLPRIGDNGFSGISGLMAVLSFAVAAILALVIVAGIGMTSLALLIPAPFHQTWSTDGKAHIDSTGWTMNYQYTMTNTSCFDKLKATHTAKLSDVPECRMVAKVPTAADIAAMRRDQMRPLARTYAIMPALLWAMSVGVLAWGLFQAGLCFLNLSKRRYFAPMTVRRLRNFAFAGLFFVVSFPCLPVIYRLITGAMFSFNIFLSRTIFKPVPGVPYSFSMPGTYSHPHFAFGVDFSAVLIVIYAFALAIIATVMTRASALADDHAQIV